MASATYCDRPRAAALPGALRPNLIDAACYLGLPVGTPPDPDTTALLQQAAQRLTEAAVPRMAWARLPVADLEALGLLRGQDIRIHLQGCDTAVLLAVTLGPQADAAVRRAGVGNVAALAAADAAASALTETAADAAEAALRAEFAARGLYLTGRYAPGYGDWPLAVQPQFCTLLDTPRLLGLVTGDDCLLLPRKSTTALLGVSHRPVTGHRAGCTHCALRQNCPYRHRRDACAGAQG